MLGQARRSYESRKSLLHTATRRAERIQRKRSRYFSNLDTLEKLVKQLDLAVHADFCPEDQVEVLGFLRSLSVPSWAVRFCSVVDELRRRFPCLQGRTYLRIDWIVYLARDVRRYTCPPRTPELDGEH